MHNKELINLPVKLNIEDYQRAEKEFIDVYSSKPFVKSIYGFGSVTLPGVSDLDFVIAVKSGMLIPKYLSYNGFSKKTAYILSHNPFLFQESIFSSINIISNFGSLIHRSGVRCKEVELMDYNQDYSLLILIDYCNYFYPRVFLEFSEEEVIDVRLSIQLLNAFSHSIALFRKITTIKESSIFDNYLHNLKEFKKVFFSLSEEKVVSNLLALFNEAATASCELIIGLDKFINKYYWTSTSKKYKIIYKMSGYVFINKYLNSQEIISQMRLLRKIFGGWITILPISFAYPLIKYGNETGCVSKVISDNLVCEESDPKFIYFVKGLQDKMKVRAGLLNEHYNFYLDPKNRISPVHDYYQMSGLKMSDDLIKLLNKYV